MGCGQNFSKIHPFQSRSKWNQTGPNILAQLKFQAHSIIQQHPTSSTPGINCQTAMELFTSQMLPSELSKKKCYLVSAPRARAATGTTGCIPYYHKTEYH